MIGREEKESDELRQARVSPLSTLIIIPILILIAFFSIEAGPGKSHLICGLTQIVGEPGPLADSRSVGNMDSWNSKDGIVLLENSQEVY